MYWHRITSDATYEQACKVAIDVENIAQTKAVMSKLSKDKTIQVITESQSQLVEQCKLLEKQVNQLSLSDTPRRQQNTKQIYKNVPQTQDRSRERYGNRPHQFSRRPNYRSSKPFGHTTKGRTVETPITNRDRPHPPEANHREFRELQHTITTA